MVMAIPSWRLRSILPFGGAVSTALRTIMTQPVCGEALHRQAGFFRKRNLGPRGRPFCPSGLYVPVTIQRSTCHPKSVLCVYLLLWGIRRNLS